ncbi:MAG TPA: response regulator transcription factor [Bacteroidales bacterium]|nr:response regulator transcription factor [Bacteroidales bacterium]HRZ20560.1 response regulator transcription factor [Bacteroidales bacterium]
MVAKIFLVEDDENFGSVLKLYLEMHNYEVHWEMDGARAIADFRKTVFDICILDVMLPHIDGFSIARHIKKTEPALPVIFLTAKTLKQDEVEGYRIGADDYIKKPFDSEVLLYKIQAVLKRNPGKSTLLEDPPFFQIGTFQFQYTTRCLILGKNQKTLSPKEADLLHLLCLHMNNVLSRETALKTIWGNDTYFTTRSMDVYITRLRKYFQDDPMIEIENIHGSGYRLIAR